VDFGSGPEYVTFDAEGRPIIFVEERDAFNYLDSMYLQMPLDQVSVGLLAHYESRRISRHRIFAMSPGLMAPPLRLGPV
jgi:hypothetical protein